MISNFNTKYLQEANSFYLLFKPTYEVPDNKITEIEVSIIYTDKDILVHKFSDYLQKDVNINSIDICAFEEICKIQTERIINNKDTILFIINISYLTMCSPYCIYDMVLLFRQYNIPPSSIKVSFIASTQKLNSNEMQKTISFLQKQGIKVGLNHLNINFSTLTVLTKIHFNNVKPISKSLVDEINAKTQELSSSYNLDFCRSLKFNVLLNGLNSIVQSQYIKNISNPNPQELIYKEYLSVKELSMVLQYEQ